MQDLNSSQYLWKLIKDVQRVQNNTQKYIEIYQKIITKSTQQQQQFIQNNLYYKYQSSSQYSNKIDIIKHHHQQQQNQQQYNKEDIQYMPQKMNLSRIFEEITLGDQIKIGSNHHKLIVNLVYQEKQFILNLNKTDNTFNLSNFSSFNNQKVNDNNQQFDIKELLYLIQQKTGKQLNKQGIQKIISQIKQSIFINTQQKPPLKDSEITMHSLAISQIHQENLLSKQNQLKFSQINKQKICQENKQNKKDSHITQFHTKCNKQNDLTYLRKKKNQIGKQIRIVKKNGLKNTLIIGYTDLKQFQNFCISNKIYGKDKDKILKAIKQNKSIVSLD